MYSNELSSLVATFLVISSSSVDEEGANHDHAVSMKYILEDIKNVQANIHDDYVVIIFSEQCTSFDRYRDSIVNEEFNTEIMYQGNNLLRVAASTATKYAGSLLKMLFTEHEL
ncbi:unnamed protein product [Adineta steineri]|uniref:Uncharacterized protein n=1 Tax=Adineta steineri TaxID=433720 RepID=A0A820AI10_9BILA|nr:unnamed protein product [Adineta steineri]